MVDPVEGPEHILPLGLRNARPVVLDLDGERAISLGGADVHMIGEAGGIVDEVGDRALEGMAAHRHDERVAVDRDLDGLVAMGLGFHLAQDLADIGAADGLAGVALGESHIVLEHGLHLVDIGAHGVESPAFSSNMAS